MSTKSFSAFALTVILSLSVSGCNKNLRPSNPMSNKDRGASTTTTADVEVATTTPVPDTGASSIKNVYGTEFDTDGLHYCYGKLPIFNINEVTEICYKIKKGETLWSVAEKYYGSGFKWNKIWTYQEDSHKLKNIKDIAPGVEVVVYSLGSGDKFLYKGYPLIGTLGIDSKTEEVYTVSRNYGSGAVINNGKKLYDGPFEFVRSFIIDWKTNNKIYLVDELVGGAKERPCERNDGSYHGFRVIFNKKRNEYYGCGWDYKLLTFSPSGKHYAVRNNEGKNRYKEKFLVLSDIGNSYQYYDYVDSIYWDEYDNLYYRAKINDKWLVVVNNVNGEKFNYVDDLKVEGYAAKYRIRNGDGTWAERAIGL